MKAAKIDAKNQERKRYRAEIYAINKFLKEQEQLRYEAMLETLASNGNLCDPQAYESGDDSSLSNCSGEESEGPGDHKRSQRKEDGNKKQAKSSSFGV